MSIDAGISGDAAAGIIVCVATSSGGIYGVGGIYGSVGTGSGFVVTESGGAAGLMCTLFRRMDPDGVCRVYDLRRSTFVTTP